MLNVCAAKQRQPTSKKNSLSTSSNCMPRALIASVSTPTLPPKNRKSVAGDSVVSKTIKTKALDALPESGWLGSPANIDNRLEKEGSKKDLEMDTNGVKFGPPLRRKRTKQDSLKEVAGMDMSGAKFGPPLHKKRKKKDGSSTADPVEGLTSSTCNRNLMVSLTSTSNDPNKYVWQIIPILSPASVKRLADFDKEVVILNSEDNNSQGGVDGFQIGNEMNVDIEDVSRTDEKEGEAIKMADALRSHGSIRGCCQETQEPLHAHVRELTHEEGDIGDRGIASNAVGPLFQENLKEASPSQEVIDGGRDSSTSARTEIPSGVGGIPLVCSCKLQRKDWLMILQKLSTATQPGAKIGTHLELSNILEIEGERM